MVDQYYVVVPFVSASSAGYVAESLSRQDMQIRSCSASWGVILRQCGQNRSQHERVLSAGSRSGTLEPAVPDSRSRANRWDVLDLKENMRAPVPYFSTVRAANQPSRCTTSVRYIRGACATRQRALRIGGLCGSAGARVCRLSTVCCLVDVARRVVVDVGNGHIACFDGRRPDDVGRRIVGNVPP